MSLIGSSEMKKLFSFRGVSISKVPREDHILFHHNAARSNEIKAGLVSPPLGRRNREGWQR